MATEMSYDLRNLCCTNSDSVNFTVKNREEALRKAAIVTGQSLIASIFGLPVEDSEYGPLVALPEKEEIKLPRKQRIPEPKAETKWEKFAREKGIKNTKKERMVYDEANDVYRPRYGYKSIKSVIDETPVVEIKQGMDPYADPWAEAKKEKVENRSKNMKRQLKNQEANLKRTGKMLNKKSQESQNDVAPFGALKGGGTDSGKRSKGDLKKLMSLAQRSTASMGSFDLLKKGEAPMKKISGKKRAFKDNLSSVRDENVAMKSKFRAVADQVDKKARKVSNSLKDYEGILPEKSSTFKAKKGARAKIDSGKKKGKGNK